MDANTGYTVADVRRVMPGLEANGVGWLEEPFPAHDHRSYAQAATLGPCRSPPARITTRASSSRG